MNKYILLSLLMTAAAFGAAHDKPSLNEVINAARRNDAQVVLAQGVHLAENEKRKLVSDLDFLDFIVAKIETKEITQHNKSEFLELCPIVGDKLAFQALKTGNTAAIREHVIAERTRLIAEANEREQAENARKIAAEKAAAINNATQAFNAIISRYAKSTSCDARDAMVQEITQCAFKVHALDNKALLNITAEVPFMALIESLATNNNTHALRQIKDIFALRNLPMNDICSQAITALVHAHEDAPHGIPQPASSNQPDNRTYAN